MGFTNAQSQQDRESYKGVHCELFCYCCWKGGEIRALGGSTSEGISYGERKKPHGARLRKSDWRKTSKRTARSRYSGRMGINGIKIACSGESLKASGDTKGSYRAVTVAGRISKGES